MLLFLGKRRYNIKLWKIFTDCFNCLPVAAIVDEKIFCCHGGLSPDLQSMEQIRRIMRPTDVPDQGLLCDLLWSDPDKVNTVLFSIHFMYSYCYFYVQSVRIRWAGEKMTEVYHLHLAQRL